MQLALPRDDAGPTFATVQRRIRNSDGNPIGKANNNPILDSPMFEVEFQDGYKTAMAANAIAQNFYAQVDSEGRQLLLLDEIIDHQATSDAVQQADACIKPKNRRKR